MLKILQNVDSKKVTQQNNIPVRITKENKLTFSNILSEMFNFYMNNTFPNGFKNNDIQPVHKKNDPFDKTKYRSIKFYLFFESLGLYNKIYEYIDTLL